MKSIKNLYYVALAALVPALFTSTAQAETLSGMMNRITDQMGSIAGLAVAAFFVVGVILGGVSINAFKENAANPNQAKPGKAIGYLIASAALIGIPSYLAVMTNTLTGEGHESSDSTGETYKKIS